jgi:hypothetical protein
MLMRTDAFRARSASWTAFRASARSRTGPPRSTDTEAAKFARGGTFPLPGSDLRRAARIGSARIGSARTSWGWP